MKRYEATRDFAIEGRHISHGQVVDGESIPAGNLESCSRLGWLVETDKPPKKPSAKAKEEPAAETKAKPKPKATQKPEAGK